MLAEQLIHTGRNDDFTLNLFQGDGVTPVQLASDDVVRIKVHRAGQTPVLDLSNLASTTNGSAVSIVTPGSNQVTVRFAQADTAPVTVGPYRLELDVVDMHDNAGPPTPIKFCDWGILHFMETAGGDIGPT